ncbi:MAG TPA: carboxypeptidase regulatory-like domain-containing protein, partial [Coriobacteriia bacterium]
ALVGLVLATVIAPLAVWAVPPAGLSGTVTESDGVTPLAGIQARLYKYDAGTGTWPLPSSPSRTTTTAADGSYVFLSLQNGTPYRVGFLDPGGAFATEYYDGQTRFDDAAQIVLPASPILTGVNASLAPGGSIRGTVRDGAGLPVAGVTVNAYRNTGGSSYETTVVATASSGSDGAYALTGIAGGSYGLQFFSGSYASHYRSTTETRGVTAISRATPVAVVPGESIAGVDETMLGYGHVSGTVGSAGGPLSGVTIDFYRAEDAAWVLQLTGMTTSLADGSFTSGQLVPGRYRVLFTAPSGYPAQYHRSALTVEMGTDVTVPDGATAVLDALLIAADGAAPVTSVEGVPADWSSAVTASFTATDGVGGSGVAATYYRLGDDTPATYAAPVPITREGSNTLSYWSVDRFGNVEETRTIPVKLDLTPPATTSNIDSDWHTSTVTVSLVGTDTGSGVAETWHKVGAADATTSLAPFDVGEGRTRVDYWSVDYAGNVEDAHSGTVTVDMTPPTVSSDATIATYPSGATINITASDALSGVTRVVYRTDGATEQSGTVVAPAVGTCSLDFRAQDAVGNWSAWSSPVTVTVADPPAAPGVSSSTHPDPAAWYNGATATAEWTAPASPSGIVGYSCVWDDAPATEPDPVVNAAGPTDSHAVASDGVHYFHVRARNGAGVWGATAHLTYRSDRTAPVTGPSAAGPFTSAGSITLTPSDAGGSGLDTPSTTWALTGAETRSGTGVSVSVGTVGSYRLEFSSVDRAGNREATRRVDFVVNAPVTPPADPPAAPPVSSTTHPDPATRYAAANVTVGWTAPASPSGIAGYSFAWDDAPATVPDTVADTTGMTASHAVASDGVHYFHVRARNGAGVWGATAHLVYRSDRTPPITSASPTGPFTGTASIVLTPVDTGGSGPAATHWVLSGPEGRAATNALGEAVVNVSTAGAYHLEFRSVDVAGNLEEVRVLDFTVSAPVALPAGPATSITIRTDLTSVRYGRTFILSGLLTPGRYLDKCIVWVRKPGSARWSYSSARLAYSVNPDGSANWWYRYLPKQRGTFAFKVSFPGDAGRLPCVSPNVVYVRVR